MTNKEALRNLLYCKYEISKSEFVAHLKHGTVRLAIIALGKQIPKKPTQDDCAEHIYYCPCCSRWFNGYQKPHHCECGQALDWDEDDDETRI